MTPADEDREFAPIPNPFITGAPVRGGSKVFFGREDHFTYVRHRLIAEKEGIVLLFAGERRSGKTSVLFQILAGRLGEEFLPVFLDMAQLVGVEGDREFFARLAQLTIEAVKDDRLVPAYYDFSRGNPVITFDRLLGDIKEISPERQRLIFLVDEAEMLREKVVRKELSSAVLMCIASSLENRQVSFCLTGSPGLRDSQAEGWRHLLGKADYREITFLSPGDTLRLIQQPVEGDVTYAEGVAEAIYNLTAGHPFYTQVICTNVVDYLNQARRNTLTMEDLSEVIRIIIANPPPQLVYAWDELSPQEQITLSLVSEQSTGPQAAVTPQALLETIERNDYPLQQVNADVLHMAMETLYKRTVLGRTQEGAFYCRVDLFRQWICQARSVWGLVEEQAPPKSRRSLWVGAAAAVLFLTVAGLFLALGRGMWVTAPSRQQQILSGSEMAGPATGDLWVGRYPEGAEVLIDGQWWGKTTPTMVVGLEPGHHVVEVRHPQYRTLVDTVRVEAGLRDTVGASLHRLTGRLTVTSQPAGVRVQVQGEQDTTGVTPFADLVLPTGKYTVEVGAEGYVPWTKSAEIAEGDADSLHAKLTADVGNIYLISDPSGAQIFLDEEDQGRQTPFLLAGLRVGQHRLKLALKEHQPRDTLLNVGLGHTDTLRVRLAIELAVLSLQSKPSEAEIYLDEVTTPWGRTPIIRKALRPGTYMLRAVHPGYKEQTYEVSLQPGQDFAYTFALESYRGTLRILGHAGTVRIINMQTGEERQVEIPDDVELDVGKYRIRGTTGEDTIEVVQDQRRKVTIE